MVRDQSIVTLVKNKLPPQPQHNEVHDGNQPELAVWEFAGLFVTYWCNARCAFCYVYSGPQHAGDMDVATAVRLWQSLDALAASHGLRMRIHLAGGEPFRDWPRLAGIVRAARDAHLSPLEKIETNAFWATDDNLTRNRLELLDALGMEKLVISTDIYHQEYIPFERVERCVRIARQVLGRSRVRVRWWDFFHQPVDPRRLSPDQLQQARIEAIQRHRERLSGRAAVCLASLLPRYPARHFAHDNCQKAVLGSRHVHIDAYGNIFPGVCSGIVLGCAHERTVEEIWQDFAANWCEHPVVEPLVTGGSYELMQRAAEFGYQESPTGYADKCHLCTHVRQYLHNLNIWPEHIAPAECYQTH
ncbi:MAG: radical SAM protein [Planctomycetota bacterium]